MGHIVQFWPVFQEERAYVWVDELAGNVEFVVLHLRYRGLWYEEDSFLLRNPSPLAAEVDPVHGIIVRIGYSVRRLREFLLAVEVSEHYRWWLVYVRENNLWVVAQVFQVQLFETNSVSEDESSDYATLVFGKVERCFYN